MPKIGRTLRPSSLKVPVPPEAVDGSRSLPVAKNMYTSTLPTNSSADEL